MAVWIDGELLPDDEARISVFDHGLVTGDGVFETVKVTGGVPFALSRHLARLARSAAGLGLAVPDPDRLRAGVLAVISAADDPPLARLRITVTGGISPLSSERGGGGPSVIIALGPQAQPAPDIDVVVVPWRRNEHGALTGLKTISYAENVRALAYAAERGGREAIFANTAGELCEGTGTNVFVVTGGELVTPPLSSGCLAGITRELVIEWCGAVERPLPLAAFAAADEAFLTGSSRDVQPIRAVDGRACPGVPGPVTLEAARTFAFRAGQAADP
ncbi:MAG: aminotransferase class IV [Streptosporangiaceae bacterium]